MLNSIQLRRQAAEFRQQAETAHDGAVRQDLIYLAQKFEEIAAQADHTVAARPGKQEPLSRRG